MSNHKLKVVCIECPYCDGENVIQRVKSEHSEVDLSEREIACRYCRSIFALSESKNVKICTADSSLSKQELDAA